MADLVTTGCFLCLRPNLNLCLCVCIVTVCVNKMLYDMCSCLPVRKHVVSSALVGLASWCSALWLAPLHS
jgi:hypothetical protein